MEFQRKRSPFGFLSLEPGLQEIKITHAKSAQAFYVIIRQYAQKLREIENIMKAVDSRDLEPIGDSQVGLACMALSEVDNILYRAEILDVSDKVLVCFVDNGRVELLSKNALYFLPHDLIDIPSMAVRCCLSDKSPSSKLWTSKSGSLFRKVYLNRPLVGRFINSQSDASWTLEIIDSRSTLYCDIGAVCFSKKSLGLALSCGTSLSGTVCWFSDYSNFYVQLSMLSESFGAMMSALQVQCNLRRDRNSLVDPQPGDMVAALFCVDEVWYRAKIEQINNNKIEVYFVDYGNKEIVSKSNLLSLSHEFILLPEQAMRCSLANINASAGKMDPNFQGEVKVEVLKTLGDKYVVDLFHRGVSLSKKLGGKFINEFDGSGSMPSNGESKSNSRMLSKNGNVPYKVSLLPLADYIPVSVCYNSPCKVYVTYVTQSAIWVQMNDDVGKASSLLDEMDHFYGNEQSLKQRVPSPIQGRVYACKCTDGNWYRSQILQLGEKSALVHLIDYGNDDTVPIEHIHALADRFEAPLLCLKCKFDPQHDLQNMSGEKLFDKFFCQLLDVKIILEGDSHIIRFKKEVLPIKVMDEISNCNVTASLNSPVIPCSEASVSESSSCSSPSSAVSPIFTLPGLHLNIEYCMEELNVISLRSLLIKVVLSPPGVATLAQVSKSHLSYPKELRVGAYYYSLREDYDTACRVQILSCSGDSYFCYYVDEGRTATLPTSNIFECIGEKNVPPLWWSCNLSGVKNTEENVNKLKNILEGGNDHLTVVPLQYDGCGSYTVQIYREGKCISEMLQSTSYIDVGNLSARLGSVFCCFVTLVSDKTYEIKLGTDHSMMNHLVTTLYDYYSCEREKLEKIEIGMVCACFELEYGTYCRGKIISVLDEEKAIVFLLDYGCNKPYKISDLLLLPSHFSHYRAMSNFAEIKSNHYLEVEEVNLLVTGNEGKYLSLTPLPYLELEKSTQFFGYSQRIFYPGQKSQGICSFSISPSSFWIQFIEDGLKLSELARDLSLSYSTSRVPLKLPCVLDVCVFYYLEEGMDVGSYFRGLVTELQSGSCRVQFVDYGNSASVPLSNIYVLKEQFSTVPLFSTQCSLNLSDLNAEWSEESLELFEKILDYGNKEFNITFINQDLQYGSTVELFEGEVNLLSLLRK